MATSDAPAAKQTILVVDDETTLLDLVRTMLMRAGFGVLEAASGEEALAIIAETPEPVKLMLTDVLMPEMNGCELAQKMKEARPDIKILYMSGYTDKAIFESTGRSLAEVPLLRKPFTAYKLVSKINEVLEESVTA